MIYNIYEISPRHHKDSDAERQKLIVTGRLNYDKGEVYAITKDGQFIIDTLYEARLVFINSDGMLFSGLKCKGTERVYRRWNCKFKRGTCGQEGDV